MASKKKHRKRKGSSEPRAPEVAAPAPEVAPPPPLKKEEVVEDTTTPAEAKDPSPPASPESRPERPAERPSSGGSLWLALLGLTTGTGFFRHIHSKSVFLRSLAPTQTLGLGLLSLYMGIVVAVTGVLLMVYYVPSVAGAYGSIQDLHAVVPFGGLIRNIHRWAGHAMVLFVALHLLRTILTGSYKRGRHGVWSVGIWLFVITLAFAFTGYLLPWDQLAFWAVSIGANLADNVPLIGAWLSAAVLGGEQVSETTLVRFYALHVGILPLITTGLVAVHLYRVRRAGGLTRPEGYRGVKVPAWPHLIERELALGALALALVIMAAVLFDAPLGPEPDMAFPDNPSKAPWYFLGLQEMVSYSSLVGGVIVPTVLLLLLILVPVIDRSDEGAGQWLSPSRWGPISFGVGALVAAVVFPAALAWYEGASSPPAGLNPATLLGGASAAAALGVGVWRRDPRLTILCLAGSGSVGLLILTVVGLLMRGASWALVSPFGGGGAS